MINILHLLWIVPLAASLGFMFCALLQASRIGESRSTKHSE